MSLDIGTLKTFILSWWFKVSAFFILLGLILIAAGWFGFSTVGVSISNSDKEVFGAPGSTVKLDMGRGESVGGRWAGSNCQIRVNSGKKVLTKAAKASQNKWILGKNKPSISKEESASEGFMSDCSFTLLKLASLERTTESLSASMRIFYPIRKNGKIYEKSIVLTKSVDLRILDSKTWKRHELSRITMASGIIMIILTVFFMIFGYGWIKVKKHLKQTSEAVEDLKEAWSEE